MRILIVFGVIAGGMRTALVSTATIIAAMASVASVAQAAPERSRCARDANAGPSVTRVSASRGIGCSTANVLAGQLAREAGRRFPRPLAARFAKTWEIDREQGTSSYDRFRCRNRAKRIVRSEYRFTRQTVTCVSERGQSFRTVFEFA